MVIRYAYWARTMSPILIKCIELVSRNNKHNQGTNRNLLLMSLQIPSIKKRFVWCWLAFVSPNELSKSWCPVCAKPSVKGRSQSVSTYFILYLAPLYYQVKLFLPLYYNFDNNVHGSLRISISFARGLV